MADDNDAALRFLDGHPLGERLWTHYNIGGEAIGKLYPEYKVFIDGRADFYGDAIYDDFKLIVNSRGKWRDVLKKHKVETLLCDTEGALAQLLSREQDWVRVYSDTKKSVFARRGTFDPRAVRQDGHAQ